MSKNLWVICTAIVIVLISITLIALLVLLPQETPNQGVAGKQYEKISKQEFIYTPTKGISEDKIVQEYKVGTEAVREGKSDKDYDPGNVDPFADEKDRTGGSSDGTDGTGGTTNTGTKAPTDAANK